MTSSFHAVARFFKACVYVGSIAVFSAGVWAENNPLQIKLLTSSYPPYTVVSQGGQVSGISTEKVRLLMEQAGLNYEILVMPWSRALRVVSEDPHAMIFPLDRTEEREGKFRWFIALNQVENGLIGRKGLMPEGFDRHMVVSGHLKAVCSVGSSKCELLRQYGFSSENILRIAGSGSEDLVNLILRGRAAFAAEDPKVLFWHAREMEGLGDLQVYDVVGEGTTDYLAAGLLADPAMLEVIFRKTSLGAVQN